MTDAQQTAPAKLRARDINETLRYAMWSVFAVREPLPQSGREAMVAEVEAMLAELGESDLVVRGLYDVAGLRADADLMVWWHAPSVEVVQEAYRRLRRTALGPHLEPVWSVVAVHRPAEFNKGHVPACIASGTRASAEVLTHLAGRGAERRQSTS